jgi:FATC domain
MTFLVHPSLQIILHPIHITQPSHLKLRGHLEPMCVRACVRACVCVYIYLYARVDITVFVSVLKGRDFSSSEAVDVPTQVSLLVKQATSHESLCQCYIGW